MTFQGGINFSYKTTSEIQYPKVKLSKKAFKKLDFGLTAGGTYHFKGFSQKGFFIDISFYYNLLNILNTSSTEIQGYDLVKENKLRSAITQIGVGYKI